MVNTLVLASLLYVTSVVNNPQQGSKVSCSKFSIGGKTRKNIVRYTNATNRIRGGAQLIEFETKVRSHKLAWFKRLSDTHQAN